MIFLLLSYEEDIFLIIESYVTYIDKDEKVSYIFVFLD